MTNSSSTKKKKAPETPRPPEGWTRCHFYLEKKHRFCRQLPSQSTITDGGPRYCGNHLHLLKDTAVTRKRVPCPVDPTHWIFQDTLEKHVTICPKAKRQRMQQEESFYHFNKNAGGYGKLEAKENTHVQSLDWAQRLALRVLKVHQQVFTGTCPENVTQLSLEDIRSALPVQDLSSAEYRAGLTESVEDFRIRSGGPHHLHQQASLVGHLRCIDALPPIIQTLHDEPKRPIVLLEMGAGRGMTGLVAAGVAAASTKSRLIMIERDSSRSKADTILRKCQHAQPRIPNYMDPASLEWTRIKCDLQHVDIQSVLQDYKTIKPVVVVVAKHLCGAGTDLALKSLEPIQDKVSACVMATCCHGLCDWEHYVGRDFLTKIMKNDDFMFGAAEFELLRRWSAGTVRGVVSTKMEVNGDAEEEDHKNVTLSVPGKNDNGYDESMLNISKIVDSLKLACGANGLGRACQRLIDYGRREYLQKVLLQKPADSDDVELLYYVTPDVTPQNAALVGRR